MIVQVLVEGVILGILLIGICAIGIRNGAVGMVHLYHHDVQDRCVELGLTTHEKISRNSKRFKFMCIPGTEELKPYITGADKRKKWIMGTVGMAVIAAILSGIATLIM